MYVCVCVCVCVCVRVCVCANANTHTHSPTHSLTHTNYTHTTTKIHTHHRPMRSPRILSRALAIDCTCALLSAAASLPACMRCVRIERAGARFRVSFAVRVIFAEAQLRGQKKEKKGIQRPLAGVLLSNVLSKRTCGWVGGRVVLYMHTFGSNLGSIRRFPPRAHPRTTHYPPHLTPHLLLPLLLYLA